MKYFRKLPLKLLTIIAIPFFAACSDVRINEHKDWKTVFDNNDIKDGCFEYFDNNKEIANYYNKEMCSEPFTPASTFKIFNSLVALETGVALDEQMVIKFDGHKKMYKKGILVKEGEDTTGAFNLEEWNKDLTMAEAFKVSAIPYFQELARRITLPEMQKYLDSVKYGNMKMGGVVDNFWLNDTLKISPDEQVGFLKKLYHDELPFSARTQRIVKGMMLQESDTDYKLYYKTGWGNDTKSGEDIIWIVGWAETIHRLKNPKTQKIDAIPHPYFFSMCFKAKNGTEGIIEKRIKVLHELLTKANIHKY